MKGSDITVPYDKSQVKSSPGDTLDGELSQKEEAELYRHYGLEYSEQSSDSGLPEGSAEGYDVSGPTTDDAMTRSEEDLHIGKSQQETGRARLKKYVVTEDVTEDVQLQREEVRIEREPITDSNVDQATSGADITDEEHEVALLEEQVVTEEQQVSEQVRKEQIEEPEVSR